MIAEIRDGDVEGLADFYRKVWETGPAGAEVPMRIVRDGRDTWLVITRWRDQAAFEAWVASPAFAHGHRSEAEAAAGGEQRPVGVHSELWSYDIALAATPSGGADA